MPQSKLPGQIPAGYSEFLAELKERIRQAQLRAALAVNQEMVLLYWETGHAILRRQEKQGWGAQIIDQLSADLRTAFPRVKGFSIRNLKYMRAFAKAWPEPEIVQQLLHKLPWSQNLRLIDKLKDRETRLWYARGALEYGWSRDMLVHHIETRLHLRKGNAQTNFERTLPAPQSDLARQVLKDPYNFDFLGLAQEAQERDIEQALTNHIRDFLLELGVGFSFMGTQVRLEVGGDEFFIDMLFYHVKLRAYVVIELKAGKFKPADAGQLMFYLGAVDAQMRHPDDGPTIGLLLCRTKNRLVVEYTLQQSHAPLGVSEYMFTESLPDELRGSLPTIEELEAGLSEELLEE